MAEQQQQQHLRQLNHARPVVSEALGLVVLDAADAALPLANRTPPAVAVDLPCDVRDAICSVLT